MCGTVSSLFVLGYVILLLRMPPEQMLGLGIAAALIFVPTTPACLWIYSRVIAPVTDWLDHRHSVSAESDSADTDVQRSAFAAVVNLPLRVVSISFFLFVVPASLVDRALLVWFEEFQLYHASLMFVAIVFAAGLTSIIEGAVLKHWLENVRAQLTLTIADPMLRSELARPLSLATKLQVVITLCMLVPVIFAALVGYTRSTIPAEAFANSLQSELSRTAIAAYRDQGDEGLAQVIQSDLARALNAAIIAAQAGDHGHAFSVVAGQIKGLANRVLASTKEISELIDSVQQESQSAMSAMEEGTRSVAVGVERSGEAGKSLEEITQISRESGLRIREIVQSVQEQTVAAGHVVDLMERVRSGVETIQVASAEQERGNELVLEATQTMRDVAQQLHLTTAEQSAGLTRIRESVNGVQTQMESIDTSLQGQSKSTNQVVGFLEEVSSRSVANERAARLMGESTEELSGQAQRLRTGMGRFQRS